jgi:NinB protein
MALMAKRATIVLDNGSNRDKALHWVRNLPAGTRCEFKEPRRSIDQNSLFWSLLSQVSEQKPAGRDYPPEIWKVLFLQAWGREVTFYPTLDGETQMPIFSSSDLSKQEMTDAIEFIYAWSAQNGVVFRDEEVAA